MGRQTIRLVSMGGWAPAWQLQSLFVSLQHCHTIMSVISRQQAGHAALLCESPPRIPCPIRAPRPLPATRSWKKQLCFQTSRSPCARRCALYGIVPSQIGNVIASKSSDGQCHKCVHTAPAVSRSIAAQGMHAAWIIFIHIHRTDPCSCRNLSSNHLG